MCFNIFKHISCKTFQLFQRVLLIKHVEKKILSTHFNDLIAYYFNVFEFQRISTIFFQRSSESDLFQQKYFNIFQRISTHYFDVIY
jgi:hypothetical protein